MSTKVFAVMVERRGSGILYIEAADADEAKATALEVMEPDFFENDIDDLWVGEASEVDAAPESEAVWRGGENGGWL